MLKIENINYILLIYKMSVQTILDNCTLILNRNERFCENIIKTNVIELNNLIIKHFSTDLEKTGLTYVFNKMINELYGASNAVLLLGAVAIQISDNTIYNYKTVTNDDIKITTNSVKRDMSKYLNYDIILDICKSSQLYLLYFP